MYNEAYKGGERMKNYWLIELRETAGMTQEDLAKVTGLSRATINYAETGRKLPTEETARKIAEALNFDWTRFFVK